MSTIDLKAIFSDAPTTPRMLPRAPIPAVPAAAPATPAVPTPPTSDATDLATILADCEQQALFSDSPQTAGPYVDWVMVPDTRGRIGLQAPNAPIPFLAWEDLVDPDAPPPAPDPTAGPCPWCGRREWWRSIYGATVCGHCHPPAVPELVAETKGGTFHPVNREVKSEP